MNIRRMLCLLLFAVAVKVMAQVKVEPGVSLVLAQYRAQYVRDVAYNLSFTIPGEAESRVAFEEEIAFEWGGDGDLHNPGFRVLFFVMVFVFHGCHCFSSQR